MPKLGRRDVLLAGWGTVAYSLAGCVSVGEQATTESPETTTRPTRNTESLTDWERSTDCEASHDNVIRVQEVKTTLGDEWSPIQYDALTPEEKTILRTVTAEGGYGTCEESDAFERFLDRVSDHSADQEGVDGIFLNRDGTYYRLYVEVLDQVYAY